MHGLEEYPRNIAAEKAVLGSILISPENIYQVVGRLSPKSFYLESHKAIFSAMSMIAEEGGRIDPILIQERLKKDGDAALTEGGQPLETYIWSLVQECPYTYSIDGYVDLVREKEGLRKALDFAARLAKSAYAADATVGQIKELLIQAYEDVEGDVRETVSAGNSASDALARIASQIKEPEKFRAWVSPWGNLNKIYGGIRRGTFNVIAARPGMGKTAFVQQWGMHAANSGVGVAFWSLEMTQHELMCREFARMTGIDLSDIIEPTDASIMPALVEAAGNISNIPGAFIIDDTPSLNLLDLRSRIYRLTRREDVGIVIIDYLSLLQASTVPMPNRVEEVSRISRTMKMYAKQFDVALLVSAQLNRNLESRQDKKPQLSDLRESGGIEQDADSVLFLHREGYYFPDADPSLASVIVAKNRNGPLGTVPLYWHGPTTSFQSVELEQVSLLDFYQGEGDKSEE